MNIFIFDVDPEKNVQGYCDKHVRKMILEYAQILSNIHWRTGKAGPYKPFNINHPSVKWTHYARNHYAYVVQLGLLLCKEYEYRFDRDHKTADVLQWLDTYYPEATWSQFTVAEDTRRSSPAGWIHVLPAGLLDAAVVRKDTPTLLTTRAEAVPLYREYFNAHKQHIATWTRRDPPEWFVKT